MKLIVDIQANMKIKNIDVNHIVVSIINCSYNIHFLALSKLMKIDRQSRKILTAFRFITQKLIWNGYIDNVWKEEDA